MDERTEFVRKSERELVFTRTFDAPRELVWKAWTDPAQIPKWWGPRRYETIVDEMDLRPGGRWRFRNRDAEQNEFAFHGEYREVVAPERLVQTFVFERAPRSHMVETATMTERDGRTTLTIVSVFHGPVEDLEAMIGSGMEEGARETYDRFAEHLQGMQAGSRGGALVLSRTFGGRDLVITRIFDAPREAVWKAWTDPEQVRRWWGPKGFTAPSIASDFRVGGKYLYCMRAEQPIAAARGTGPEGRDYWSTGVYREIVPMERIVATDSFADEEGNVVPATHYGMGTEIPLEMLVTVTFEDLGGKTKLALRHAGLPAGEHIQGAEAGWSTSLDKLSALVEA